MLGSARTAGRVLAVLAVAAGAAALAIVLLGSGGTNYTVHAIFQNASQLVKGDYVRVSGAPVGQVKSLKLTPNGQAQIDLQITNSDFAPLRQGTTATVRLLSLSGVANRYVDLRMPPGNPPPIPNGGIIDPTHTSSAVDIDEVFNTFDKPTRTGLTQVIRGFGRMNRGEGKQANRGWMYLNPSLNTSTRLFNEVDRDTPMLERFIVASSKLVTDLASRRNDLAGLIENLNTTMGAIGRQDVALQSALGKLPPFMRRADTTFVNLRNALDDLKPLVDASKPVAPKLRALMAQLRPLTRDARPTLHDLVRLISRPGRNNDLIELTKGQVPLRNIAIGPVFRNGAQREGAFPASTRALQQSIPEMAYARPYAVDLTGWFDDFGHTGIYDALGGEARSGLHVNAFAAVTGSVPCASSVPGGLPSIPGVNPAVLCPVLPSDRAQALQEQLMVGQMNRCPGAADYKGEWRPTPDYPCDPNQQPVGPPGTLP